MSRPKLKARPRLPLPPERERTPAWEEQYLENHWLGLGDVLKIQTKDPFAKDKGADAPGLYVLDLMSRPEYFSFACKWLLNKTMYPFQLAVLAELWVRPFPMLLASRGAGKSFMLAVYAVLRALFDQGSRIVVVGAAFRQAKVVYEYIAEIWDNAPILRGLVGAHNDRRQGPKRDIDRCSVRIGTSIIHAIPLGTGEKIRGLRANILISDEFASIPVEIFETVVRGFAAVSADPISSAKRMSRRQGLKDLGKWRPEMDEEEGGRLVSNQTIVSGTASFAWNHFHGYWKRYKAIVESRGDEKKISDIFGGKVPRGFNWRDFSVIRIPFDMLPEGYMDEKSVAQAKATIDVGTYLAEYGCCFIADTAGFFKRSLIEGCVAGPASGIELPSCGLATFDSVLRGVPGRSYVIGVDPASLADNLAVVVLEIWDDHRRVVHGWTTNKGRYSAVKDAGLTPENTYYQFCARKIRDLMKAFPCSHLAIDAQGGGVQILEALSDPDKLRKGELPLHPVVDPDKPQPSDALAGLHVVELVQFADLKYMREANNGLKKDMETKSLLFPAFNAAKVALAFEEDRRAGRLVDAEDGSLERVYDTLEDCMLDIEELKNELATIECRQTPNGRDQWDTPEFKVPGQKKGRLRKDRYSALLMANTAARRMDLAPPAPEYFGGGGFAREAASRKASGPLYSGPAWYTEMVGPDHGAVVRR